MRLFVDFIIFFFEFSETKCYPAVFKAKIVYSILSAEFHRCRVVFGRTRTYGIEIPLARRRTIFFFFFLKLDINPIRRRFQPVSDGFSHGFYTSALCTIQYYIMRVYLRTRERIILVIVLRVVRRRLSSARGHNYARNNND